MKKIKQITVKKYSVLQNIIFTYKAALKWKPCILPLMIIAIISTTIYKFISLFLLQYILKYLLNGIELYKLTEIISIYSIIIAVSWILRDLSNDYLEAAIIYIRPMLILDRNRKTFNIEYEELEKKEVLDCLEKSKLSTSWMTRGAEGLIRYTIQWCTDAATCVFSVVVLCQVTPILAIFVVIAGTIGYIYIDKSQKFEKKTLIDECTLEERKLQYFNNISKDFAYGKDIRLFKLESMLISIQKSIQGFLHQKNKIVQKKWIICWLANDFIGMIQDGVVYVFLINKILNGVFDVSSLTLYIGTTRNFAKSYTQLMQCISDIKRTSSQVNDFRTYNEYCEKEPGAYKQIPDYDTYEFKFENVSFKYPNSEQFVLKNINLTIKSSQKLAVVGLNGAGKTTFIKLLCRLYEPTEGQILMNGIDIKQYDKKEYFKLISPVFQDPQCYAFTFAENVSMKPLEETNKELVVQSLIDSGLESKMNELQYGINTQILKFLYEDGVDLSGGQKQKMSLARALYKNAPIIILDEPTAALDALAEYRLYTQFNQLVKNKTAIYISHRLSSTRFCDMIAMFNAGNIVEYGTHQELIDKNGEYRKMYNVQAQYYKEEVI